MMAPRSWPAAYTPLGPLAAVTSSLLRPTISRYGLELVVSSAGYAALLSRRSAFGLRVAKRHRCEGLGALAGRVVD